MATLSVATSTNNDRDCDLMKKAIQAVTIDDGFRVPSPLAEAALKSANSLLSVWPMNAERSSTFSREIVSMLEKCFIPGRLLKVRKEKMWKEYHRIRTSSSFVTCWKDFLKECLGDRDTPSPIFYQFVTDTLFKELVKLQFPVSSVASSSNIDPITQEETMALRYVAGYVCRKVRKDLELSKESRKDDMIFCVLNLSGDHASDDEESLSSESWLNAIDRGGLWHVSDETFTLFHAIEEHVRQIWTATNVSKLDNHSKDVMIDDIMKNEDILFQWCILTVESDEDLAKTVLKMLVKLYVTVRGFSFAASCLEIYKQRKMKSLQRAKGIRKELFTSKVE